MTEKIRDLFFGLLKSALTQQPLPEKYKTELTEQELNELMSLANAQAMAHIIADGLEKARLLGSGEISAKIKKLKARNIFSFLQLENGTSEIFSVLDGAGVVYVPLKGSVIRKLYPEEWMRTSCDVDVLVKEQELEKAVAAFEAAGYTAGEREYHDISLYSKSGVHLELHFSILENNPKLDKVLGDVWSCCSPVSENSNRYEMSSEFAVFYSVAHSVYHFTAGGCGVRPFADLWIMKQKLNCNEDRITELCEEAGIKKFYEESLNLADVWFGNGSHTETTLNMQNYLLSAGIYGSTENAAAVGAAVQGSGLKYLFRRIFPPFDMLVCRYPALKNKKYLYLFYCVKRFFDSVRSDSIGVSVGQAKAVGKNSAEKVQNIAVLFGDLDL